MAFDTSMPVPGDPTVLGRLQIKHRLKQVIANDHLQKLLCKISGGNTHHQRRPAEPVKNNARKSYGRRQPAADSRPHGSAQADFLKGTDNAQRADRPLHFFRNLFVAKTGGDETTDDLRIYLGLAHVKRLSDFAVRIHLTPLPRSRIDLEQMQQEASQARTIRFRGMQNA